MAVLCAGWLVSACAPQEPLPLRVATNVWVGYESLYLARSLGLYEASNIRLVEMQSASEVSRAIRSKRVEAAALTLDEALNLRQLGLDLRVVLVMDVSDGADALVARPDTRDLQQLRGKRIGVERGAVGALMLDAALDTAGLRVEDVQVVTVHADEHLPAWRKGRVDAVVTFDPMRSLLLQEGGHTLFDSRHISGRILDVLVVRADVLPRQDKALRRLLEGHFAALRHMREHPADAAARMAPRLGSAGVQAQQFAGLNLPGLADNRTWLAGPRPRLTHVAAQLQALMLDGRLLQKRMDLSRLAEAGFLPEGRP